MDVTEEEDRGIIADKIPVALFGIELNGAATDIALRIGGTALASDSG